MGGEQIDVVGLVRDGKARYEWHWLTSSRDDLRLRIAVLRDAMKFMREHTDICEANALIVYAWNEYDEGGWLAPTRSAHGPNTSRLDAVRTVLSKRR